MSQNSPFESSAFQEKVVQALLTDKIWAFKFVEIFNIEDCLEFNHLKLIAARYVDYAKKYKCFPSDNLLIDILKEDLASDEKLKQKVSEFLKKVMSFQDTGDLPWVKERAMAFCKQQTLKKALLKCVDVVKTDKYESTVEILKEALKAGAAEPPPMDYMNDIDVRYSKNARTPIPTNIFKLDDKKVLNGGLGKKEIGIIAGITNSGKSHCLVHMGAEALKCGFNVFYYTLEMSKELLAIRFDSHLVGIPSLDLPDNIEVLKKFLAENKEFMGRLHIQEYPALGATTNTIKMDIERRQDEGLYPDLVIVDYAGIIRSTERLELLRLEMQRVIQELRAMAKEYNVAVWTALQANRSGTDAEVIDLKNLAESFNQASDADVILGLNGTSLYVAKNRAGLRQVKIPIKIDTSMSTIIEIDETTSDEEVQTKSHDKKEVYGKFKDFIKRNNEKFE